MLCERLPAIVVRRPYVDFLGVRGHREGVPGLGGVANRTPLLIAMWIIGSILIAEIACGNDDQPVLAILVVSSRAELIDSPGSGTRTPEITIISQHRKADGSLPRRRCEFGPGDRLLGDRPIVLRHCPAVVGQNFD